MRSYLYMFHNSLTLDYLIATKQAPTAKQVFGMAAGRWPRAAQYPHGKKGLVKQTV